MDTLGYAKRLRDAGISQQQAESHAEAARDFIMAELVTKTDLHTALQALRADVQAVEARLEGKIDTQTLRLTVRLGALLAAGIAILAAVLKLT